MKTLVVPTLKPRNSTVTTLRTCRCAVHGKSRKAQRRSEKVSLQREAY